MGTTAKRVLGGLLAGAGTGLLDAAKANRDEFLLGLQNENALRRDETQASRAEKAAGVALERSRGLLSGTSTDSAGNVIGITRGGDTKNLGFKDAKEIKSGLSVEDKREMDQAIARETSGKGSLEGEVTDWDAVAQRLTKGGRPDLAARIASMDDPASTAIDVDSAEYREAQRLAEEWASDQAGYFSKDKTDFANYGGNRAEAIRQKTTDLYAQLTGRGAAAGGGGTDKTTARTPPGRGTETDPFKASTQADVDWFRDSAPAGTVIEVDGTLYRK